ncbi:SusC/RagA family TonB-linked outer membrane protein [Alkaliflexus imshenetskii]|uniref:SusC/RagA family TonB-linked outer membrane protein n=1 Tax=Alkaliflexus imshenetskii TaxID=286730 RepID=UPI00047C726A|nr:TonB-dependent receptor [Alkaliflexus imshenetskii]
MKKVLLALSFVLVCGLTALMAQTRTITGTVTGSDDGMPIPGASVFVKGTTIGTVTQVNGSYSINVPADAQTLVYSFVGMRSQEQPIAGRSVIDVILASDAIAVSEVVVIGYGTRLKAELTGSIASVRASDIADNTAPTFESALQGRAAGVHVVGGSGKLGQAVRTRIRGASSISASNQPLYVIDGMPVQSQNLGANNNEPTNPIADLNPNDIESIQVLKDASAAAIYGSRASNGVILVTTKRGKPGRTTFNFSSQIGISEPANKVNFLNRAQYLDLFELAYSNVAGGSNEPYIIWDDWTDALDWGLNYWRDPLNPSDLSQGPDTNWEDEALRRGSMQQFDFSASGGNEKTQFYAGLSTVDQTSIVNGNSFDRISGRLNLDQKATDNVSFGMNMNLVRSRNFRVANDNAFSTPLQMVALPPLNPKYNPNTGELNSNTLYENGLIVRKHNMSNTEIFRNFGNLYAQINILPSLSFRTEAGVDLLNQREIEYRSRLTNDGGPEGEAYDRSVNSKIYNLESFFTYNQKLSPVLDLNVVLGNSLQQADFDFAAISAKGFPNDNFKRIASASEITNATSSGTGYRYNSYFSRANLKVMERFLIDASGRFDGSSRFGKDNRYGFFPSAALAWIASNEDFLLNNDFLSFLKPRISWGVTGNSEIDNFAARGLYMGSNYAGLSGMVSSSIPSPDLKWETTTQTNVGVDFGFFNNRITGEIDYYFKKTTDLLLNVQIPGTTGFSTVYRNVGEMENKGWEFVLNTVNIEGPFSWSSNFNITFNKNKITNLDGQVISSGIWRVMEGQPIGVFYTKEFAGVDPTNGDALFYLNETGDETTTSLSAAANRIVGDPNPDFWGGFTNSFRYAGFDLNVMFQFVYGHDIFNQGRQWQADGFSWFDNQVVEFYENIWRQPGDNAKYPQPRFYEGNGYGTSSMLIFDGSYIRLKEVSLGYTIPKRIVQRGGLENVRVFARAYNLLTITDYPGWDPEASSPGTADATTQSSNIRQGWDFYTAPQPRTLTFGLNMTF